MNLAIMQPYLFPYIGYFQLINSVDCFVFYDDVNYIKQGWINRNNILEDGKKKMFTLSLKKASQNKWINEIKIIKDGNNIYKLLKRIEQNYCKAPFFNTVFPLIESIMKYDEFTLSLFIKNSIEEICRYLDINTQFVLSSQINKNNNLRSQSKILEICKIMGANTYINPIGGVELYSREKFEEENIELKFLKTKDIYYKQFKLDLYIPSLSIIDVLMFNSKEDTKELLKEYTLL